MRSDSASRVAGARSPCGRAGRGPPLRGGRALRAALALGVVLLLPSCFTAALWDLQLESEVDPYTGERTAVVTDDGDDDTSVLDNFFAKVLLTPFTVALDCLTCPVQAVVYGFDCDDDDDER